MAGWRFLAPGERLPSTRQAAADYGVSRGMLEEIYAQFHRRGLFFERARWSRYVRGLDGFALDHARAE